MPRAGFETAIPATERPQTYALDRVTTAIGSIDYKTRQNMFYHKCKVPVMKTYGEVEHS
jgi:hypothetical protein